ncbi:isoamyl acetate-hydrolyzing esterase [Coemansia sp. RSA 2611]|nr:isoamyl acetate-hydrolyzing esterase [Coemansia sp. RSA 2611]
MLSNYSSRLLVGNILLLIVVAATAFYGGSKFAAPGHVSVNSLARRSLTEAYTYESYDTMLVFGDSITQYGNSIDRGGYVARLANYYQRQMDVINRGFAGYNSSGALEIANTVLPKTSILSTGRLFNMVRSSSSSLLWPTRTENFPGNARKLQLCILFFGANDALVSSKDNSNTLDNYYKSMHSLVAMLQDSDSAHYSPDTRILIITPPPVGELMLSEPKLTNNRTSKYVEVAKKVATEVNVPYIDLFSKFQALVKKDQARDNSNNKYDGYDKYFIDGVHPNAAGNSVIFDLIMSTINSTWPEIAPSAPKS